MQRGRESGCIILQPDFLSSDRGTPVVVRLQIGDGCLLKANAEDEFGSAGLEAAKFGRREDPATHTAVLGGCTTRRSLLIQCKMRSIFVVGSTRLIENAPAVGGSLRRGILRDHYRRDRNNEDEKYEDCESCCA
jgi:hypothetical protein